MQSENMDVMARQVGCWPFLLYLKCLADHQVLITKTTKSGRVASSKFVIWPGMCSANWILALGLQSKAIEFFVYGLVEYTPNQMERQFGIQTMKLPPPFPTTNLFRLKPIQLANSPPHVRGTCCRSSWNQRTTRTFLSENWKHFYMIMSTLINFITPLTVVFSDCVMRRRSIVGGALYK
jgi:hypothetical protein